VEIASNSSGSRPQPPHQAALILRLFLAAILAVCVLESTREGLAAWHADDVTGAPSLESIRWAERWDPSAPEYHVQYAEALAAASADGDVREVARELETATKLGPNRAGNWVRLGEALDRTGNGEAADLSYQRALGLFPRSPEFNWYYANFLIRANQENRALAPLRLTILGDPALRVGAFDLAWRAGLPAKQILEMVPERQEILSAYLDYLTATNRLDAAAEAWKRLIAAPEPFNIDAAFRYFDALIRGRRTADLVPLWTDLARHDARRIPALPGGNLILNGGFESPILNGGFDWRISPVDGAEVSLDTSIVRSGARSLAIRFDGSRNVDFSRVVEYVAVEPGASYRFTANTRTEGITTDSGPRIRIYDPFDGKALSLESGNLTGASEWTEQRLDFRTGPETHLIVVQVARPPSRKFDSRIEGKFWMDDVSLIRTSG
jgi:hypothetical protein